MQNAWQYKYLKIKLTKITLKYIQSLGKLCEAPMLIEQNLVYIPPSYLTGFITCHFSDNILDP